MKNDGIISLLGIAKRAGKVVSGEFATEKEVKAGYAELVIVAQDASDNTKKKFQNMVFVHSTTKQKKQLEHL